MLVFPASKEETEMFIIIVIVVIIIIIIIIIYSHSVNPNSVPKTMNMEIVKNKTKYLNT
jgi:uncharacterized protein YpmB